MDLLPTEEQQQILDTAGNYLGNEFPVQALLEKADGEPRLNRDQLKQVAGMGWIGIGLPDTLGGVGYGLSEEALLFAELGRYLMPPSLLGSVLGARIAAVDGKEDLAFTILDGSTRVALATRRPTEAASIGESVNGEFLVLEADDADYAVVADETGAALLPLAAMEQTGAERCIDPTLDLSHWRATESPGTCHVAADREAIFLRGALLTSAMLLGIAEATLKRSVDYAQEREQFGKPIGSFQAIKHYCAEMSIRCECVRAMLYYASITLQHQPSAGPFDTSSLKALAIEAAQTNANTAIQIHGGMGYTQEMDIHLFVKRSQVLETLFGSERFHLKQILAAAAPE
jgi:alkylation response protein AidB-like acyl-CoA dehydrogenase